MVAGIIYWLVGDPDISYALGTMWLIVGLIALSVGLLGAIEPTDGWAIGRGTQRRQEGRRSIFAKVATEAPRVQDVSSGAQAVWGLVVGGGLIGLSVLAFSISG